MSFLSFTVYYTVAKQANKDLELYLRWFHVMVWGFALIFVIVTWSTNSYGHFSYFCFITNNHRWAQLFWFLPMCCCLIMNLILFIFFVRTAHKKFTQTENGTKLRVEIWLYSSLLILLGLPLFIAIIYTITLLANAVVATWQVALWYILANGIGLWLGIINSVNMNFFKVSFWCAKQKQLSENFSSARPSKAKLDVP